MDGVWIKVDGEWTKATTGSQVEIEAHANNTENPHKVTKEQIGLGDVKNIEQASKSELELHKKSTGHITEIERDLWNKKETPEGAQEKATEALGEAKSYTDTQLKGTVTSVNSKKPNTSGNVDLGELVHSVAGIAPNVNGDVNLKTENINVIKPIDLNTSATEYPMGVTVFYKNVPDDNAPSQYGNVLTLKGATATTFQLFAKNGFIPQSEEVHFRIHHVTKGWTDWFKLIDSHDLSDSTSSDSSDTVATSKAIKYLNDALIGTDDSLRQTQLDVKDTVDAVSEYKKKIHVNSNRNSVQIGFKTSSEPLNYLQIGRSLKSSSGSATQREGSVNISSLATEPNDIQHPNAMVFGVGLTTMSEDNKPFYKEGSVTYIGQYNQQPTDKNTRFLVGIGNRSTEKKTGMRMASFGDLMINGQYKTSGADYAEMFEWEDKNPENTDRVALAVTWGDGESIKLANSGDEIIGIVSATAAVLGDNPDEWDKRFITDQFGRKLMKEHTEINEDGEEETYEWFVENPEYDKDTPYIPRSERPEWSAIGLVGKLYWIDDGTLEVGDYATVGENGVATKGTKENGHRVMKRISKNADGKSGVIKVFFK